MSTLCDNKSQTTKVFTCAFLLLLGCCLPTYISTANILCFFPTFAATTFYLHGQIAELLATSGHNVTVIGTIPNMVPNAHFKYIQIKFLKRYSVILKPYQWDNQTAYWNFIKMVGNTLMLSDLVFLQPMMQDWIKDAKEDDFDLLIFGYFLNDFQMGLASLYKCPIIISSTTAPTFWINRLVGNPAEASYVPSALSPYAQQMDSPESCMNFWIVMLERTYFSYMMEREQNEFFCLNFDCQNVKMADVRRNISLVFTNHHFTQGPIRPNVPSVVEIGGIQIPEQMPPLQKHIADHINKAENGVIYINLGKSVNCTDLPKAVLDGLFMALVESRMTVLWRWTHCSKPRQSSKILYTHWMPQNGILAQKSVKLFITHGSMASLAEGQYHAVPMLAITYLSEQVGNVEYLAQYKLAMRIDAYDTNWHQIRRKLFTILNDPTYKRYIDIYSRVYRDRPMSPRETVLYWVNYVLRYRGTPHMRSPAADMSQIEMLGLDLVLYTLGSIILIWKLHVYVWCCLTSRIIGIIRKLLRKYLFARDYEIVIERPANIRYDKAVVDRARECQIRRQNTEDPEVPRVVAVKTPRQRKGAAGRRKH